MAFRISITKADVQDALTTQGYTNTRAAKLDNLDVAVSTRSVPGDAMDLNSSAQTKVRTEATNALTNQGYTTTRAGYLDRLDVAVSSRAAPGAAMDLVAAAKDAIWNVIIPATPTAGSYGERIKNNLNAAVSTRAVPGDAMDLNASAETKVRTQVDNALAGIGATSARMAKLDYIGSPVTQSGSVAAASNTSGLVVTLDTNNRTVVEVRYTAGAAASFTMECSDDNTTWYTADSFSESAAVTNKIIGYLNGRRYVRFKSPTTGIDLSFQLTALL